MVSPMGPWAFKHGIKSAYELVSDYAPGHDAEVFFAKNFKKAGGKIVGGARMPLSTTDFSVYVEKALKGKPDALYMFVPAGGTLAVLGRNGVGKTTLLTTITGFTSRHNGSIKLDGRAIENDPSHKRVLAGIGYVPQRREFFPSLSAEENLLVAARQGGWSVEALYELFPSLAERRRIAGNKLVVRELRGFR
jgi:ABC-type uncharacterized transport system ATPase subunit